MPSGTQSNEVSNSRAFEDVSYQWWQILCITKQLLQFGDRHQDAHCAVWGFIDSDDTVAGESAQSFPDMPLPIFCSRTYSLALSELHLNLNEVSEDALKVDGALPVDHVNNDSQNDERRGRKYGAGRTFDHEHCLGGGHDLNRSLQFLQQLLGDLLFIHRCEYRQVARRDVAKGVLETFQEDLQAAPERVPDQKLVELFRVDKVLQKVSELGMVAAHRGSSEHHFNNGFRIGREHEEIGAGQATSHSLFQSLEEFDVGGYEMETDVFSHFVLDPLQEGV